MIFRCCKISAISTCFQLISSFSFPFVATQALYYDKTRVQSPDLSHTKKKRKRRQAKRQVSKGAQESFPAGEAFVVREGVGLVVVEAELSETHQVFVGYVEHLEAIELHALGIVEAERNLAGRLVAFLRQHVLRLVVVA